MKILAGLLLGFFILPCAFAQNSSYWQIEKSQHFIIYYQDAPNEFIEKLVYQAEDYYNSIVEELGFRRFDFWSWDNRAKIYLYNNSADYLKETQSSPWSGGQVSIARRTIKTFIGQEKFFDSTLPHEMTHMVFREYIGLNVKLPLWIDEGVACSQEKSTLSDRMETIKSYVIRDTYLKFEKLSEIHGTNLIVPELFYSESASLILFLIETYSKDAFLDFSRKLRDGIKWDKAILDVYHFSGFEEMEAAWKSFVLK